MKMIVVSSFLITWIVFIIHSLADENPRFKRDWGDPLPDLGYPGYNCSPNVMAPSKNMPTNVHSIRPADIKLIMALGDSLTAANGAGATDAISVLLQYRGLAFLMGADKDILLKYNPKLFGQSYGICAADVWECAFLNIAQPGAKAVDMPGQATEIVRRMQDDHPEIDFNNDWKLLSIFIGGNDFCSYCRDPVGYSAANFAYKIQEAIEYIYDHVPRVIVQLVTMLHVEMEKKLDSTDNVTAPICQPLHEYGECKCLYSNWTVESMNQTVQAYQQAEMLLQDYFENKTKADNKTDFTFVIQPFINNAFNPAMNVDGTPDLRMFAPDCFHFSQLGHAGVATWLWKNMLEPVGSKTNAANLSSVAYPLGCPDPTCPFIRTTRNSQNCAQYLTPSELD
uniref:Lipase_GDSL domain-containing protein n=1 Tax=Acrobeloides nanus TaxID=290746 RepID=A0A914EG49_9BILA